MNKFFLLLIVVSFFSCHRNSSSEKKTLNAADLVHISASASSEKNSNQNNLPVIHFYETEFDFGDKVMEGEVVTHNFKFKNTGNTILIISKVETSCGCTATEFSKEPVKPNEESSIKVSYDSNGRPGSFQKTIIVVANTEPSESKLLIIGDVLPVK
jgi:Protein of unknown function (DUF1573)